MFPSICSNDRILVEKVPLSDIETNDIVVFESDDEYKICHRLVAIKKRDNVIWLIVKGEGGGSAVAVDSKRLAGRVIAIMRGIRFIKVGRRGHLPSLERFRHLLLYMRIHFIPQILKLFVVRVLSRLGLRRER